MIRLLMLIVIMSVHGFVPARERQSEFAIIPGGCQLQNPRFPVPYGRHKDLLGVPVSERLHRDVLDIKDEEANLHVEATLHEIDLDRDGTCDLIITIRDPITSGGDS